MLTSKFKKMWSGTCIQSELYDKIIKMPSKPHETIPLKDKKGILATCCRFKGTVSILGF
jgi:hypothetical protein